MHSHTKGLLIMVAGSLSTTPDTLTIRLTDGTEAYTLMFWRYMLFFLPVVFILLTRFEFDVKRLAKEYLKRDQLWLIAIGSILIGSGDVLFTLAVKEAGVAITLCFLSASPFVSAILSRMIIGEKAPCHTWAAVFFGFGGIMFVFADQITSGANMIGTVTAMSSTFLFSLSFVINRFAQISFPETEMLLCLPWSSLLAAMIAMIMGYQSEENFPLSVASDDWKWVILQGLVILPISFSLITVGSQLLPSPEAALITLMETLMGPLWVWLAVGESPTKSTLIGGGILVSTVLCHSLVQMIVDRANGSETRMSEGIIMLDHVKGPQTPGEHLSTMNAHATV